MMKAKTKIFGISILLISCLLFFPNIGMACFNPTDSFATEVALSKPSITYDLSGIKQSKDVTVIEKEKEESPDIVEEVHREEAVPKPIEIITIEEGEEKPKRSRAPSFEDYIETNAIIYRSHYNKDVAVALMEEEWEGQKYLDVKIQVPTKFVYGSHSELRIKLDNLPPITQEVNQEYFKSLGYENKVGVQKEKFDYLRAHLIKENIDIAVWSYIFEEEEDDEKDEKRESFSGFSIQVRDQSTLTPELEEEFKNILEAYGFNPDVLSQAEITPRTIQDVDLEPAIDIELDTYDWGQALRTELEWLQNNNVISGLTDDDIYGIIKVADKGTAGWNSKIRYFKGEWMQGITEEMSEETGMYMMKGLSGCGGFPAGLLPEGVPGGVTVSHNQLPFTVAPHQRSLIFGVIIVIFTIASIAGIVLCGMGSGKVKNKNRFCKLFGVVGFAFIFGVIFQFIQVVVFDTFGIDRILGIFMEPSLVIVPVFISTVISHFYHKDNAYIIGTGMATLVFAVIALSMYHIG